LDSAQPIQDIELAVHKLSRLFNSLLLLTKLESTRYNLTETVLLEEVINYKLSESFHLIDAKKITVTKTLDPVNIIFHHQLAEILTGNLLNNAIRYNHENGNMLITLSDKGFTIANTSSIPELSTTMVFQRFYRHNNTKQDGNGLGLSIVKQICDVAGYTPSYKYLNNMHTISILF
jgi:two-component system sensor histidine kinase QseC